MIDGNEIGYMVVNVFRFARPSRWAQAPELIEKQLTQRNRLQGKVIAYRDRSIGDSHYIVVHSSDYTGELRY